MVLATDFSFSAPSINTAPVSITLQEQTTPIILNPGDTTRQNIPLSVQGFYPPVDMPGETGVVNTIRGGSTVPLKFNIYDPNNNNQEITDVAVVKDFRATQINAIATTSGQQIPCGTAPASDV